MAEYGILADMSSYLLEVIRSGVCPALIPAREMVALNAPDARDDGALLNLYLYDLRERLDFLPQRALPLTGTARQAPLAITAAYMVYFSRHAQTPSDSLLEQSVLGSVFQTVYQMGPVDIAGIHAMAGSDDEPASLSFFQLDLGQKQDLWGAFSQPLRPAVYFEVGPLLIDGGLLNLRRVKDVGIGVDRL